MILSYYSNRSFKDTVHPLSSAGRISTLTKEGSALYGDCPRGWREGALVELG
jgi:hypothetical protein